MKQKPLVLKHLIDSDLVVQEVNFQTMFRIVQACERLNPKPGHTAAKSASFQHDSNDPNAFSLLKGIAPGTKWCGVNDIANNYFDLGESYPVDKCCRAHDHCPMKIKPFSSNYGVRNYRPYTA